VLVRGGKTEIDRKVAEALAEPPTHILRNAIDHGIEPPAERERAGKPPKMIGKLVSNMFDFEVHYMLRC
jgi:two-component system chemotaxis sensor kinase CheA